MGQIFNYVVESLRNPDCDFETVEKETGVSRHQLVAIVKGEPHGTKNPGILTVEPLYHYFKKTEGRRLRRRAA